MDNRDYFRYLDLWRQNKAEMDLHVYAYVLMTNHVHWLLKTGITPLSEIIHRIHSTYARWFNHRHERVGHLFQGRCKNFICADETYLLTLARYIHQNPVRSGLAKSVHLYPWSSYHLYASARKDDLVTTDFLLNYFSQNKEKARLSFMEFSRDVDDMDYPGKTPSQKEKRQAMPSSKIKLYDKDGEVNAFADASLNKSPSNSMVSSLRNSMGNSVNGPLINSIESSMNSFIDNPNNPACNSTSNPTINCTNKSTHAFDKKRVPSQDLEQIALWIEKTTGVTLPELKDNNQRRHVVLARSLFIKIAVSKVGIKRSVVASHLGKERSLITKVLGKWYDNRIPAPTVELLNKFSL